MITPGPAPGPGKPRTVVVNEAPTTSRRIKGLLRRILADRKWEEEYTHLITSGISPQKTISPLFAALYSTSRTIRWHAVSCFGIAATELLRNGTEQVRIVLRRCTWSLNDESGGIGWGAPEAMAEILACTRYLADEYASILISFVLDRKGACNFLEYAPLREGAYWGIARLAQVRPDLILPWREHLIEAMECETSPFIQGAACLIISHSGINDSRARVLLDGIGARGERILLYWNKVFWNVALSALARNGTPSEEALLTEEQVA